MSPQVTLSEETFRMLQTLATPFVDTPESVIAMLASSELSRREARNDNSEDRGTEQPTKYSPDELPDLKHTKLLSAKVDGRSIPKPKWNGVLDHLHVLGLQRLGSFATLRRASSANIREGRFEENGFGYVPEADLSIQGVDANLACRHTLHLAQGLEVPVHLNFEWRKKDGAAHPGRAGIIEWEPSMT